LTVTAKEAIKLLKADGWVKVAQKGSHLQMKHPTKPGKVTVPVHNRDLHPKTLNSIRKQAGWK